MQEKEQKLSPIKQRILRFADSLGVSKREFYKIIGVSRGTLESKTGITEDVLAKFIAAYPDVRVTWLLTGEGPVMQEKEQKLVPNHTFSLQTDRTIDQQDIPLYDYNATAGLVAIFNDHTLEPSDFLRIPNLPPVDGAIYVRGESMSPLLKSGDIVMYKKKELSLDSILWGEIYLLSFVSDGDTYTAVKYIQKADDADKVRLASFNPTFAPKDIPMSSITALALVKASLTFHTME
ncbi:MAG: helix-turn-helix transcriptional regulator [Bacteroidales bacterium]|nr:helix-turn-helix transcriptional regulator [Bacteroidales bacterium]